MPCAKKTLPHLPLRHASDPLIATGLANTKISCEGRATVRCADLVSFILLFGGDVPRVTGRSSAMGECMSASG